MYLAKHMAQSPKKAYLKYLIPVGALAVLGCIVAAATMAYISAKADAITNEFKASTMAVKLHETFNDDTATDIAGLEKTNVYLENAGDASVYVRVRLMVQAQDAAGNLVANPTLLDANGKPLENQGITLENCFTLTGLAGTSWTKIGDCYYYTLPLTGADGSEGGNDETSKLLTKATQRVSCENGITLSLIVLSEAMQENGIKAGVWGDVALAADDTLTAKEGGNG